jgi:hypothetical protein
MNDNYNDNPYCRVCHEDVPYPVASPESVPSLIDNLVAALYGGFYDPTTNTGYITKNLQHGRYTWNIPCDPNNTASIPNYPRQPGEGLLCYILRVFASIPGNSGTTVGLNFLHLANPNAIRYPRIDADNSVVSLTAAQLAQDLGISNGGTTVGENFFHLTNPSYLSYPQINADNTVTALTPSQLLTAIGGTREYVVLVASDEASYLTTGANKVVYHLPFNYAITGIQATLTAPQLTGTVVTVDILKNGASIFSTPITIDNNSTTSVGASVPFVIATPNFASGDVISVSVNQIGTVAATGLKVTLIGTRS